MRVLVSVLVVALAAVVPPVAVVGSAAATPPRAELIAKSVTGDLFNGQITVTAAVRNKGDKKAGASQTAFYLSTDGKQSANDTTLGTVDTKKVKPKHSMPVAAIFPLPTNAAPGSYRVLACADSGKQVKERNETNNCKASKAAITVVSQVITVSAAAGTGGTVAASGVTGGTCAGTACTFPTPGTGTVTFTPTPSAGYRFGAWTGPSCTGYTAGAGNAITFTKPTASKTCTATFVKQVTVSWSVSSNVPGDALCCTVTATATGGTCTPDGKTGSCTVDSGASTVTLTAGGTAPPIIAFTGWTAAPLATCVGTTSGAVNEVLTITNPTSPQNCVANFSFGGF